VTTKTPHVERSSATAERAYFNSSFRATTPIFYVKEREVWYAHLGVNVGVEEDGKGKNFKTLYPAPLTSIDFSSGLGDPFGLDWVYGKHASINQKCSHLPHYRRISQDGLVGP
jgi:hypothetical protein